MLFGKPMKMRLTPKSNQNGCQKSAPIKGHRNES